MAELLVIRHGQASFGAGNYDRLSDLGHRQSRAAGEMLREIGWTPERLITGTLTRHKETLASMGFGASSGPEEHDGLNEYDFDDLFRARFGKAIPSEVKADRKAHFRNLRETVLAWQKDTFGGVRETWRDFADRVEAARRFAISTEARRVLVVSSGGVIGRMTAAALAAPDEMMMTLNLQIRNSSMTRFIFSGEAFYLHEFNAVPHLASRERLPMQTYS